MFGLPISRKTDGIFSLWSSCSAISQPPQGSWGWGGWGAEINSDPEALNKREKLTNLVCSDSSSVKSGTFQVRGSFPPAVVTDPVLSPGVRLLGQRDQRHGGKEALKLSARKRVFVSSDLKKQAGAPQLPTAK